MRTEMSVHNPTAATSARPSAFRRLISRHATSNCKVELLFSTILLEMKKPKFKSFTPVKRITRVQNENHYPGTRMTPRG
uniref:Uncharacterized protein n=1 Tax=Romanomermis culicivorax TaxID=13658 RepID=A0A915J4E6_ROMCU